MDQLRRVNSATSAFSIFSKSLKSMATSITEVTGKDDGLEEVSDVEDTSHQIVKIIQSDPVIIGLNKFFDGIQNEFLTHGKDRVDLLHETYD